MDISHTLTSALTQYSYTVLTCLRYLYYAMPDRIHYVHEKKYNELCSSVALSAHYSQDSRPKKDFFWMTDNRSQDTGNRGLYSYQYMAQRQSMSNQIKKVSAYRQLACAHYTIGSSEPHDVCYSASAMHYPQTTPHSKHRDTKFHL